MKEIIRYAIIIITILIATIWLSYEVDAGEGPQIKIGDVPDGYKLVKKDAECKEPDPCAKDKEENKKIKQENDRLKARIKLLEDEAESLKEAVNEKPECPAPKTVIKTVEKPIEKVVEKPIEKIVEKEVPSSRSLQFGGMVAYSQDGISSSSNNDDEYAEDAATYRSVIGGPYLDIPVGDKFEIGLFGMFGGVNQTFGGKIGLSL